MTLYEIVVSLLVVGLFIVISLLPMLSSSKEYEALVHLHE